MSWKPVTYDGLKDSYDYYTWDVSIGDCGGFSYKKTNNITDKPIKIDNIGNIKICSHDNFTLKFKVVGLSKTSVELPFVPKDTEFGWDHENNCWTYFTDKTTEKPTYYSEYVM